MTIPFIQSFVAERFFISTVYRRCSAALAPDLWYFETIVWATDPKTRERGDILDTLDSGRTPNFALRHHAELVTHYFDRVAAEYSARLGAEKERVNNLPA